METFNYMSCTIARNNCNTPAIRPNLKRARQVWGRISKVIAKEEVASKVDEILYQAMIATVLLCDTVAKPGASRRHSGAPCTDGFHVEVVRRITNKIPYRIKRGKERGVDIFPLCWRPGGSRTTSTLSLH